MFSLGLVKPALILTLPPLTATGELPSLHFTVHLHPGPACPLLPHNDPPQPRWVCAGVWTPPCGQHLCCQRPHAGRSGFHHSPSPALTHPPTPVRSHHRVLLPATVGLTPPDLPQKLLPPSCLTAVPEAAVPAPGVSSLSRHPRTCPGAGVLAPPWPSTLQFCVRHKSVSPKTPCLLYGDLALLPQSSYDLCATKCVPSRAHASFLHNWDLLHQTTGCDRTLMPHSR